MTASTGLLIVIGEGNGMAGLPEQKAPEHDFGCAGASFEASNPPPRPKMSSRCASCSELAFVTRECEQPASAVEVQAQSNTARAIDVPAAAGKPRLKGCDLTPSKTPFVSWRQNQWIVSQAVEHFRHLTIHNLICAESTLQASASR